MRRMRSFLTRPISRWSARSADDTAKRIASLVDADFYLKMNPDVRKAGLDAAEHYAKYGWREGRDPSPEFSTNAYLEEYPHLLESDSNPLEHFLNHDPDVTPEEDLDEVMRIVAREFDAEFYAAKYQLPAEANALKHFCTSGWRSGKNPSRTFSTSHYLTTNDDVKASQINPFWHYLVAGREEGRTPKPVKNWQTDVASNLRTIEETRRDWTKHGPLPDVLSTPDLSTAITSAASRTELIVALSHDDYRVIPGGVQLCIGIEQFNANKQGIDYLHIHPWQTLPVLADPGSDPVMCISLNGQTIGHALMSQLIEVAASFKPETTTVVCHHMAGHTPEGIVALTQGIGLSACEFWLHDYFAICTCFTLRRNNVASCGAPKQTSNACTLCIYGAERKRQTQRFEEFFETLDVHLVSPSEVALDLWQSRSRLRTKTTKINPHMRLMKHARIASPTLTFPDRYRIAFIGNPSPHKGWPAFEALRERMEQDDRFEFWMFSAKSPEDPDLHHVETHACASDPQATISGLKNNKIDVVLHWADWEETFSFSTFEAFAAGAYVVTNTASGNVAAAVQDKEMGCVLKDVYQLYDFAKNGGLAMLAEASRTDRKNYETTVEYSGFSLAPSPQLARAG